MPNTEVRPKSWRQLLESEIDLSLYPTEDLPIGRRRVNLEDSAWHKNQHAVVCFFRDLDSGRRYRITVWDRTSAKYTPEGLDFSVLHPGAFLTVEIQQTQNGTFRIVSASQLKD
jgi:hypothetical protein